MSVTTSSTGNSTTVTYLSYDKWNGHTVRVDTVICNPWDAAVWEQCRQHGHDLRVLNHYDVPTGDLICHRCWGGCPDPTFDEREAAFLAWKHWGWRATGLSRRRRLRYWTDETLSRAVVWLAERRKA